MKKINCSPKLKKNFTIPTRSDLLPIIDQASKEIVNTILSVDEMINRLASHIGHGFNVDVLRAEHSEVLPGDMDVNAFYDQAKDENGENPIEVVLVVYPVDKVFLWDYDAFYLVAKRIVDSIIHEMVHMKQARLRNFVEVSNHIPMFSTEKEEAQKYLGEFDEIDAYAYNIASELVESQRFDYLENPSKVTLEASANLWAYVNTFDKDTQNPVIKRLLKKVYKHCQKLNK